MTEKIVKIADKLADLILGGLEAAAFTLYVGGATKELGIPPYDGTMALKQAIEYVSYISQLSNNVKPVNPPYFSNHLNI
jgi:hypothetical protein